MKASLRGFLATTFTALAMTGIMLGAPFNERESDGFQNSPLSNAPYCDAECNTHLAGIGKLVKTFVDADKKRYGHQGHDKGNIFVLDDPIMDDVEHLVFIDENHVEIVEMIDPPKLG